MDDSARGFHVIYADCDTRVVTGGEQSLDDARHAALTYLKARIDNAGISTPARLARLRLAWMRIASDEFAGD